MRDFHLPGRSTVHASGAICATSHPLAALAAMENVRLLPRTTIYGAFDHGIYGALERRTDHLPESGGKPRQVHWRIYAKRSLLCAGAIERSIAFPDNDRPGIMLAGAVGTYLNRYGVAAGKRIAIFTNNDSGLGTARDLESRGITVARIIDSRNGETVVGTTENQVA